jgi:hypothetical protein
MSTVEKIVQLDKTIKRYNKNTNTINKKIKRMSIISTCHFGFLFIVFMSIIAFFGNNFEGLILHFLLSFSVVVYVFFCYHFFKKFLAPVEAMNNRFDKKRDEIIDEINKLESEKKVNIKKIDDSDIHHISKFGEDSFSGKTLDQIFTKITKNDESEAFLNILKRTAKRLNKDNGIDEEEAVNKLLEEVNLAFENTEKKFVLKNFRNLLLKKTLLKLKMNKAAKWLLFLKVCPVARWAVNVVLVTALICTPRFIKSCYLCEDWDCVTVSVQF